MGYIKIGGNNMIKVVNDKNFNEEIADSDNIVVVDFWAPWCGPCKMVAPIMEELATQYKDKVTFYKINIDQEKELAQTFNIQSIPALLYIPVKGQPQMAVGLSSKDGYIQQIQSLHLYLYPAMLLWPNLHAQ